eukprot:CAMPEP_0170481394 /NCGR_PEP_ID=MMETSP0208-20121228/1851_1 /TAXON_ID=197538 /ORGANISM="Strombidium inclinatum, Strain S3" /LENGTH=68 /DNA_ID=CAMNT_0010754081 /DNA_START=10 /DNA_END=219 /DNA_ORIENTATION=-
MDEYLPLLMPDDDSSPILQVLVAYSKMFTSYLIIMLEKFIGNLPGITSPSFSRLLAVMTNLADRMVSE